MGLLSEIHGEVKPEEGVVLVSFLFHQFVWHRVLAVIAGCVVHAGSFDVSHGGDAVEPVFWFESFECRFVDDGKFASVGNYVASCAVAEVVGVRGADSVLECAEGASAVIDFLEDVHCGLSLGLLE